MNLALHVPTLTERARAAEHLRCLRARVSWYPDGAALCAGLAAGPAPDAVVTALRDAHGWSVAPLVRQLRIRFPATPVVAYGSVAPQVAGDLVEAVRAGVAAAALHGCDDLTAVLRNVVSSAAVSRVADVALTAVDARLTPATRPVVGYCLTHAHAVPAVAQIAAALCVSRKTVAARLAVESLPPASTLVS